MPGPLRKLLPALCLVLAGLAFFHRGLFLGKMTLQWDAADFYLPVWWYAAECWRQGVVPLWNPFLLCGYPAFADPQSQTFYPLNILLSLFTDFSAGTVFFQVVAHVILSGAFMYLLAGLYMKRVSSRLASSLTYMFSGYTVTQFQHATMIDTLAWLPLVLFFLEKGRRTGSWWYALPAGLASALLILAGHPQTALYCFFIVACFAVYGMAQSLRRPTEALRSPGLAGLAVVVGVLVAAVQLLPTVELSTLATRTGRLPYDLVVLSGQLHPGHLSTLLLADYVGTVTPPYTGVNDIAHSSAYCGALAIAVLPWAFAGRRSPALFLGLLGLFTLLVSMGAYGYVFYLLYSFVPGFDVFRAPVQYRFGLSLCAALLAGIGLENALAGVRVRKWCLYAYFGAVVTFTAALAAAACLGTPETAVCRRVLTNAGWFLAAVAVFAVAAALLWRGRLAPHGAAAVFVAVAFLDLFYWGAKAQPLGAPAPHAAWHGEPPAATLLRESGVSATRGSTGLFPRTPAEIQGRLPRLYVDDGLDRHDLYLPLFPYSYLKLIPTGFNRGIMHGLFMADGYSPMLLSRYVMLNTRVRDGNYRAFLMLSNVRFVVKADGTLTTLSDEETLPRAYLVPDAAVERDEAGVMARLSDPSFNPRKRAVIERPFPTGNRKGCGDAPMVSRIVEYGANRLRVLNESGCDSLLVVSDAHYPGWMVYLDGELKGEALRANGMFRGAPMPAGRHEALLRFEPASFATGLAISSTTLAALAAAYGYARLRRKRGAAPVGGEVPRTPQEP